jgi:hypothetical protein
MEKRDLTRLQAAAARGARALDTLRPGWWRRVRVADLDMADSTRCVVGQVCGPMPPPSADDEVLLQRMARAARAGHRRYRVAWAYVGYVPHDAVRNEGYEHLQAAWVEEIRARRRAYRQKREAAARAR